MEDKTLRTLEYNKILALLEEEASCEGGRALCRDLHPLTDIGEIEKLQTETADALTRIFKQGSVNLSGTADVRGSLKHLDIGGSLSAGELLRIAMLLETAGRAKAYSRGEKESDYEDSLSSLFSALEPLSLVSGDIRRCIISEEEIADDASSGLKSVRRAIRNINDRIHNQMSSILNSSTMRTYLQDNVITIPGT